VSLHPGLHKFLDKMRSSGCSFSAAVLGHVQGGPPFLTDDSGTPGSKQWEINVGWLGAHSLLSRQSAATRQLAALNEWMRQGLSPDEPASRH
jgi:hypothetical protein